MRIDLNENFKGKLLVAMPNMHDIRFRESVIYLTEHSSIAGAVGVMVNQLLFCADRLRDFPDLGDLSSIMPSIEEMDDKLNQNFRKLHARWDNLRFYSGGPVASDDGFLLYSERGNDKLILNASDKITPAQDEAIEPILVAKGYCAWDTLQLEQEVRNNQWLVLDSYSLNYLLDNYLPDMRYHAALSLLGVGNIAKFDFSGAGNA